MTKPKKKSKAKIGIANNAKAAASKTGLALGEVKAAKDAGCPAFHPSGRVDCDALVEWIAANPESVGIDESKVNKYLEEALRVRVDRRTREVKLKKLEGNLVSKAQVRQGVSGAVSMIFTELERLFLGEAPAGLKGKDEREIYKWGEQSLNQMRTTLTAKFAAIGEEENES